MVNSIPVVDVDLFAEFKDLNEDLNKGLKSFSACIESMLAQFKTNPDQLENNKGLSFLSLKNMLMIEYLVNLMNVVYMKESGQTIKDHKSILRLAELRCIIEKSKSIDVKLKYQIDKLLKLAVSSDSNEQDPLSFKANLDNFEANDDEVEEEEDDEDVIKMGDMNGDENGGGDKKKDNVYRPPKLVPTYNDIDQTPQDKMNKEMERRKRRALHSSIMKELENEYSGAPEEIKDGYANTLETETQEERHRINYEEDNFTRKPLTKKEMMRAKRLRSGANLNSLSSFEDARLLLDENINMEEYLSAEKGKKKSSKGSKGKKGKKGQKKKKIRYT